MNTEPSDVVIDLAKALMELMRRLSPEWSRAFFRFSFEASKHGSVASFVSSTNIVIIDPFKNSAFFDSMNSSGVKLFKSLGKTQGVFLVTVNRAFDYDVKFDFVDLDRWKITKLNGGTGIPEGADVTNS